MVVEVKEQVAVLPQPLLEPGTLLLVEFDDFLGERPLDLAHVSRIRLCAGPLALNRARCDRACLPNEGPASPFLLGLDSIA